MNKKAIELSVNFLVIIILSIVMFGLGVQLIRTFFTTTETIRMDLDATTEAKLSDMLEEGQMVAVAFNRLTIEPGAYKIFGLGILNVITSDSTNFVVEVNAANPPGYTAEKMPISATDTESWTLYEPRIILNRDDSGKVPILIRVPKDAIRGTYVFDVTVRVEGASEVYGAAKIYVVV